MKFLLQIEDDISIENFIVKELINNEKHTHSYIPTSLNNFFHIGYDGNGIFKKLNLLSPDKLQVYKDYIPIGTLDFVKAWLLTFTNQKEMNPIEIPNILRTDEFLKRKYAILSKDKLPTKGTYFIKNASKLKQFSYMGELEYFFYDEIWEMPKSNIDTRLHLDSNDLFQVSEIVNILSEYRVYIFNGEIQSIAHYNGNPCILPDINLISKANLLYSTVKDFPKAYTMDIAVSKMGTFILEIHPFVSCGLYNTIWGTNLLYAYRDGIDWYINHNTQVETFSNF